MGLSHSEGRCVVFWFSAGSPARNIGPGTRRVRHMHWRIEWTAFFSSSNCIHTLATAPYTNQLGDFLVEITWLPEKISEITTCDFSNRAPESGVSRVRAPVRLSCLSSLSVSFLCWCDWQDHHLWLLGATKWKDRSRIYTQKQPNKKYGLLSVIQLFTIRTNSDPKMLWTVLSIPAWW